MILSSARRELEWAVADVAANLNLRVSVIEALERDDYTDLPGPTFVRGYLRGYARLLGVDENEVVEVDTIISVSPGSIASGSPVMGASAFRHRRSSSSKSWLLWVGLVVLIVVAWSFSGIKLWGPDGVLAGLGIGGAGSGKADPSEISLSLDPKSRTGTSSQ